MRAYLPFIMDTRPKFNDLTPMPFGQYKGKPLQDIPASYLHWLYHKADGLDNRIKTYIEESIAALKQENPDLIWRLRR